MTTTTMHPKQARRRTLLRAAAAAALTGGAGRALGNGRPTPVASRFTRMFPHLPPFAETSSALITALLDLGRAGGPMDARDNLGAGPIALITDPALRLNNPDAPLPMGTAGSTFMGQFIDHDMTFDAGSRLGVATAPQAATNSRVPALDLDSVYGRGPVVDAALYDPADRAKLRIGHGGLFEDLPRLPDGTALIADPRNDEHVVIAGLQCAFILFHNRVVDLLRSRGLAADTLFAQARRTVAWHYQWIVVNELLPSYIGAALTRELLWRGRHRGDRDERDGGAAIPVELQGAAYRFGHSLVRPSYRANLRGDNGTPFFGFIFDPSAQGQTDPSDLRGGARAPRRFVGWQTFFDFADGELKPRKRIDTRISTPLFNLPLGAIADGSQPTSLAQRNLLRHLTWQLPSGQRIAEQLGVPALAPGHLPELSGYRLGLERSTPLWYYVLREADVIADGQHLGPVGGRIVGETILGVLRADRESYLNAADEWRPTLPSRAGDGGFRMTDLLTFARVDPGSRGQ
jgi:hypothetical protein